MENQYMKPMVFDVGGIPLVPPSIHPEWQGSISSKWMDRGNGHERGLKQVRTYCRNGHDGIARQGLGAYFTDPRGNVYNEGRRHLPLPEDGFETWPDREVVWRPSRRVSCVPPNTLMKDQLTAKEKLTDHLYVRRYEAAERLRMRGLLKAASEGLLAHSAASSQRPVRAPHNGPTCTEHITFGSPKQQAPPPLVSTVEPLREKHGFSSRYAGPPPVKDGIGGDGGAFVRQELPTTYKHPNFWSQGPAVPPRIQLVPEMKKSLSLPAGKLSLADQREMQMVQDAENWELRAGIGNARTNNRVISPMDNSAPMDSAVASRSGVSRSIRVPVQ